MRAALLLALAVLLPAAPAAAQTGEGVIAYTRDADGPEGPAEPTIYVANADGSGERAYATGSAPALAVDEDSVVAYVVRRGGARQLMAGRLDQAGSVRQVTALPDREGEFGPGRYGVTGAVWSPGRTWLAVRLMEGSTTTLGFVRPDGSGFRRLDFGHLLGSRIVWRDDTSVAVGTDTGLHLVTVDGRVTDPPGRVNGDTPVDWLDAGTLLVNDAAGITVLDTGTGQRTPVLAGATGLGNGPRGLLFTQGERVGFVTPEVPGSAVTEPLPAGSQVLDASPGRDPALLELADATGAVGVYALSGDTPGVRRLLLGEELTLSNAAVLDAVVPADGTPSPSAPGTPSAAPLPTRAGGARSSARSPPRTR